MRIDSDTFEPNQTPKERFSLYSIPAFDAGVPEIVFGLDVQSAKRTLRPGDVLFSKLNPRIPRVWHVRKATGLRMVCSTEFLPFTILEGAELDASFLRWMLQAPRFLARVQANVNSATRSHERARPDDILSQPIPLPPLPEQKRIAAILEKADRIRRLRRFAREMSEGFLQSVFREMFGDPVRNEKGWDVVELGEVTEIQGGFAFKSRDYVTSGVKLVKIANVHNAMLTWNEVEYLPPSFVKRFERFALKSGDILMALTRPIIQSLNSVKVARVTTGDLPCLLNQRVARIVPGHKVLADFLLNTLYSSYFRHHVDLLCSESLQPNVSTEQIAEIRILVPETAVQARFGEIATSARHHGQLCLEAERQAEHLFQSLLARAFDGDL